MLFPYPYISLVIFLSFFLSCSGFIVFLLSIWSFTLTAVVWITFSWSPTHLSSSVSCFFFRFIIFFLLFPPCFFFLATLFTRLFFHPVSTIPRACSRSQSPRTWDGITRTTSQRCHRVCSARLSPARLESRGWARGLVAGAVRWPWHCSGLTVQTCVSLSPHLSLLVLPSSLDNYHPCHLPFLIIPWMLKLSLHHSDTSLISSIWFYFPFCR